MPPQFEPPSPHSHFNEPSSIFIKQICIPCANSNSVSNAAATCLETGSPTFIFHFINIIFTSIFEQYTKWLNGPIYMNLCKY